MSADPNQAPAPPAIPPGFQSPAAFVFAAPPPPPPQPSKDAFLVFFP